MLVITLTAATAVTIVVVSAGVSGIGIAMTGIIINLIKSNIVS